MRLKPPFLICPLHQKKKGRRTVCGWGGFKKETKEERGKSVQDLCEDCYGGCWAEIVREGKGAIARVLGAGGGRPQGFAHGRQERRDFLLISC